MINTYSLAAGAIASSPIPFSDIALLLPNQIAMITHISYNYELEISTENIKKLVTSFVAAAGLGFAVRAGLGAALKFIPVLGTFAGAALNAGVTIAVTKLIGNAYLAYINDNYELIYQGGFDIISNLTSEVIETYMNKVKNN